MHGEDRYQHGHHQRQADPAHGQAAQQQHGATGLAQRGEPGQQFGKRQAESPVGIAEPLDGGRHVRQLLAAGHPEHRRQVQAQRQRGEEIRSTGDVEGML